MESDAVRTTATVDEGKSEGNKEGHTRLKNRVSEKERERGGLGFSDGVKGGAVKCKRERGKDRELMRIRNG